MLINMSDTISLKCDFTNDHLIRCDLISSLFSGRGRSNSIAILLFNCSKYCNSLIQCNIFWNTHSHTLIFCNGCCDTLKFCKTYCVTLITYSTYFQTMDFRQAAKKNILLVNTHL